MVNRSGEHPGEYCNSWLLFWITKIMIQRYQLFKRENAKPQFCCRNIRIMLPVLVLPHVKSLKYCYVYLKYPNSTIYVFANEVQFDDSNHSSSFMFANIALLFWYMCFAKSKWFLVVVESLCFQLSQHSKWEKEYLPRQCHL